MDDLRFMGKRGTVHAQVRSVPLEIEGEAPRFLGALVDLTDLRAAERFVHIETIAARSAQPCSVDGTAALTLRGKGFEKRIDCRVRVLPIAGPSSSPRCSCSSVRR